MGDFSSFERNRRDGGSRSRFGGGGRDRRSMPACDAVCAKCGKDCKVPFKPTGDKPVYCGECFGATGGGRDNLRPIERSAPVSSLVSSGITQEQFRELNKKLDKILGILNSLEMVEDDEDESEEEATNESEDVVEAENLVEQKNDGFETADDKE